MFFRPCLLRLLWWCQSVWRVGREGIKTTSAFPAPPDRAQSCSAVPFLPCRRVQYPWIYRAQLVKLLLRSEFLRLSQ